uniref:Uncharacterized protein n=1 Tax=Oryza brachyantha TaxID=4533 RepID=J3MQ93_ORYBR
MVIDHDGGTSRSLVLDVSYNVLLTRIGQELWVHLNKLRSLPSSVCEMRSLHLLMGFSSVCLPLLAIAVLRLQHDL